MKAIRHSAILELINAHNIETQEELAQRLKDRGMVVTQATISRDIKELRLIKVLAENGRYKYATADKAELGLRDKFRRIFSQSVLSITYTGNLIVIKTLSGSASAATEAIDSFRWSEIAGTIAGNNTIFVAIKDSKAAPDLVKRLYAMMEQG